MPQAGIYNDEPEITKPGIDPKEYKIKIEGDYGGCSKPEKKYFVPTSDDIILTYNYELNVPTRNKNSETGYVDKWYPKSFHFDNLFSSFEAKIIENKVRVAFLCREDIENRGWVIEPESKPAEGHLAFVKDNFFLAYNENNNRLLIGVQKQDNDEFKRGILFNGICKDNNTLNFIFKTVGI